MKNIAWLCLFMLVVICTSFTNDKPSLTNETKNSALKILVISDLNANYGDTKYSVDVANVIGRIDEIKPDLILCGGDMGFTSAMTYSLCLQPTAVQCVGQPTSIGIGLSGPLYTDASCSPCRCGL
ncbi:MAG: hypothetical protein EOO47_28310, partial [Flavobacterium sp.]